MGLNKKPEAALSCHLKDLRPAKSEIAEAIISGNYAFASGVKHGAKYTGRYLPFGLQTPSSAWQGDLHGFSWLRHFSAGDGDMADLARHYVKAWLAEKNWSHQAHQAAWTLPVTSQRVISWLTNGRILTENTDDKRWQKKFRKALIQQGKFLLRNISRSNSYDEGKISANVALILIGLAVPGYDHWLERGASFLTQEITQQILPDGGHISRNPSEHLLVLFDLLTLKTNLFGQGRPGPDKLLTAIDRMLPMLRFFRHGDNHLALFNGAMEEDGANLQAALTYDDVRGRCFGFAPHSGYQRLALGRTLLLMDTGSPPPSRYAQKAHAGCLSLEMSSGKHRFIVNCGAARQYEQPWQGAGRSTAAHSTLTLHNTSSLKQKKLHHRLGQKLINHRLFNSKFLDKHFNNLSQVDSHRRENDDGIWLDAGHDGYVQNFDLTHRRRLFLGSDGKTLRGEDCLQSSRRRQKKNSAKSTSRDFAIRFHFHPKVRCGLTHNGTRLIARLANGEGWEFKAQIQNHSSNSPQPCPLQKQQSVYLGGDKPRRADQLVLEGKVVTNRDDDTPLKINWLWRRIDTAA